MATLGEIQASAVQLAHRRGWPPKSAAERMLYLVSEVGELAEEVIRWSQSNEHPDRDRDALGFEIYDVIWNACDLGRVLGIDLDEAADRKARLTEDRTW